MAAAGARLAPAPLQRVLGLASRRAPAPWRREPAPLRGSAPSSPSTASPPRPACRRLASLAVPRTGGGPPGAADDAQGEEGPHLEEADGAEDRRQRAVESALAWAAPAHHGYARGGDYDDPPPLEAWGDESSELLAPSRSENRELEEPLSARRRFQFGVLQRLAALERGEQAERPRGRARRRKGFRFPEDQPIRVRVLDVDALPLQDLHHAFMHTLVRRRPAEICIRVASRVGEFRDSYGQTAYENMLRDCGLLFGSRHGPELLALFARCHSTISVPFMLDYTRRFGTFSRAFLAGKVDQSLRPGFFDFMRYQANGGVRALPSVVSKPWALSSYSRLMVKSAIRSYIFEQLAKHGHIPPEDRPTVADDLPAEARAAESLSAAGALRVEAPRDLAAEAGAGRPAAPGGGAAAARRRGHGGRRPAPDAVVERPALLDAIMAAEHSGIGWDQAAQEGRLRSGGAAAPASGQGGAAEEDSDEGAWTSDGEEELEEQEGAQELDDLPGLDAMSAGKGDSRFALQFEHVVPDAALGAGDALVDPRAAAGARGAGGGGFPDELVLPHRCWSRIRRTFFRHEHRAYRLVEGQWTQVPDPRGPRFAPRRRPRPRGERREESLRRQMAAPVRPA